MQAVVRSLSFLAICVIGHFTTSAQEAFVTKKKFDIKAENSIFLLDSTLIQQSVFVPSAYDFNKLAIFCKFEEKVARNSNVNMRFRLGSLDYVNYLEQKPHWQTSKNNTQ